MHWLPGARAAPPSPVETTRVSGADKNFKFCNSFRSNGTALSLQLWRIDSCIDASPSKCATSNQIRSPRAQVAACHGMAATATVLAAVGHTTHRKQDVVVAATTSCKRPTRSFASSATAADTSCRGTGAKGAAAPAARISGLVAGAGRIG